MKLELIVILIGAVLIIEGLPYFLFPDKIRFYLKKLASMDENSLRIIGSSMIVVGFVLIVCSTLSLSVKAVEFVINKKKITKILIFNLITINLF